MEQKFIPLSVPNLKGNELEYVSQAVQSEWVSTGGPFVTKFEESVAAYVQAEGAVSCQSGTAGLHIALEVCQVRRDDEVLVPSLTFIAAVNPVRYVGAHPVFMDCDDSLTISPDKLKEFCEKECSFTDGKLVNKSSNRVIKAIIIVHVFGNMADMVKIMEVASEFNLKVIEDATEALGTYYTSGLYSGRYAGTIGDIGVYSFNGNKIITTGGGGMIVSNDKNLLRRSKHLTTQAKSDELYYTHDEVGYNYRMTNLQAALGIAQMEQLEQFIETKKRNFELYQEKLYNVTGLHLLEYRDGTRANYWFYALYVKENYPFNRDELMTFLSKNKVQTRPIWGLINNQMPYINNQAYLIERAVDYLDHIVNIPCSSNLNESDIRYICELLSCPINK
ncbi:LegC family aminotransferase [Paenibacillus cucumis (ex Kampfer et al. 2016)]|uniref:LegC family aminotransferase n=1 Tax=Paenibacillus cucumis (ex Kampfer et al. 2016) TaxID=1776858 RepID=A0ABS7KPD8_9BACL|nr:LegC family aminotransferase [Paenibacillus cucumis (ex Kampfer et al. 2016)]MBY0206042.1 LegC family aminotransferase [Paenibacillus cucumis (ex Kampfer et al. 2016)]